MTTNVTVGDTPIFDELREMFGQLEVDELLGHVDSAEDRD